MKANVPQEFLFLLNPAAVSVLEKAEDVFRCEWETRPETPDYTYMKLTLEGTSWETFLELSRAGLSANWFADDGKTVEQYWTVTLIGYKDTDNE